MKADMAPKTMLLIILLILLLLAVALYYLISTDLVKKILSGG
jgi:hypothetical protein